MTRFRKNKGAQAKKLGILYLFGGLGVEAEGVEDIPTGHLSGGVHAAEGDAVFHGVEYFAAGDAGAHRGDGKWEIWDFRRGPRGGRWQSG